MTDDDGVKPRRRRYSSIAHCTSTQISAEILNIELVIEILYGENDR